MKIYKKKIKKRNIKISVVFFGLIISNFAKLIDIAFIIWGYGKLYHYY